MLERGIGYSCFWTHIKKWQGVVLVTQVSGHLCQTWSNMVKSALATMFLGTYATNDQEFIGYSLCSTQTSKIIKSGLIPRASEHTYRKRRRVDWLPMFLTIFDVSGHISQTCSRIDWSLMFLDTVFDNDGGWIGYSCFSLHIIEPVIKHGLVNHASGRINQNDQWIGCSCFRTHISGAVKNGFVTRALGHILQKWWGWDWVLMFLETYFKNGCEWIHVCGHLFPKLIKDRLLAHVSRLVFPKWFAMIKRG